jgi:O-Antigen ligase/Tetratricopeptide repeat
MAAQVAETTTNPAIERSSESVPLRAAWLVPVLPGVAAAVLVASLGLSHGGYFPTAWGPTTLAFLAVAALALVVRPRSRLGLRELAIPGLLLAYMCWALASSLWGSSTEAVPEVQRALVYVTGSLAFALVVRRATVAGFVVGIWAGICVVAVYALGTRLFPERLGVLDPIADYRLSEPVGYWNALGLLAALGTVLALWLAARAGHLSLRLVAASSTVPLVLSLYFTFSRGAWLSLAAGLLALVALDPRRLQLTATLVLIAPWSAVGVLIASHSGPLTELGHSLASASADGHALSALGAGLALAAAAAVAFAAALEQRMDVSATTRRVGNLALGGSVVAGLTALVVALGGPTEIARSFADPTPVPTGLDLDKRLFSLAGSGRVDLWQTALHDVEDEPLTGSGAGSYERYWLAHRPYEGTARDAHSLYVETLAELGPLGLALVIAVFGGPLVAALWLHRRPFVPAAAAALVTYLVHAGIDWDWEFPVLTLVALGCVRVILPARDEEPRAPLGRSRLVLLAAVVALVPVAAIGGLGARAQAASADAAEDRDYAGAAAEARRAERLAPWSVEPLLLLGRAQAAFGDHRAARATFRRALEREPGSWRLWYELAAVSRGGERRAALAVARALNPRESLLDDLDQGP